MNQVLLVIPTYLEAHNISQLLIRITSDIPEVDILVIDDSSPDGTANVVRGLIEKHGNISLMSRPQKSGLGSAHRDGIRWGYEKGYKQIATMDADLTHSVIDLKRILHAGTGTDVVVGSRFTAPGSLPGWNLKRRSLTHAGHLLTRTFLGLPYDASGALRVYNTQRIPLRIFELVQSNGYGFLIESLFLLHINGMSIREVPVVLPARILGSSKMTKSEIKRTLGVVFSYGIARWISPEKLRICQASTPQNLAIIPGLDVNAADSWDKYWSPRFSVGTTIYDLVAGLYRRWLIRPALEKSIKMHFPLNAALLHAGCGSGQVDVNIVGHYRITAFDFSRRALELYSATNGSISEVVLGSVDHLPFPDESFDGIYNLGVFGYFSEAMILKTLGEFRRVIKQNGKIVIWWPPEFGLSVRILKTVNYMRDFFFPGQEKPQLFPPEISRIRSRTATVELFQQAGLTILDYKFGVSDMFTQVLIVAARSS